MRVGTGVDLLCEFFPRGEIQHGCGNADVLGHQIEGKAGIAGSGRMDPLFARHLVVQQLHRAQLFSQARNAAEQAEDSKAEKSVNKANNARRARQ